MDSVKLLAEFVKRYYIMLIVVLWVGDNCGTLREDNVSRGNDKLGGNNRAMVLLNKGVQPSILGNVLEGTIVVFVHLSLDKMRVSVRGKVLGYRHS
jgi:hypothetical protein